MAGNIPNNYTSGAHNGIRPQLFSLNNAGARTDFASAANVDSPGDMCSRIEGDKIFQHRFMANCTAQIDSYKVAKGHIWRNQNVCTDNAAQSKAGVL